MLPDSLVGQFIAPLLAALLVLTTPVGTGYGAHTDQLLHPVLAHMHVIDGRIVSDEQLAAERATAQPERAASQRPTGPALGAGTGADAPGIGLALGPTLPFVDLPTASMVEGRLLLGQDRAPAEYRDAPQDPPPDTFA